MDVVVPITWTSVEALTYTIKAHSSLLIEPVAQHASSALQPTNLYSFASPSLFSMKDGKCSPSYLAFRRLPYSACYQKGVSATIIQEGCCRDRPRILLLAFGSQLACKLLELPLKCTTGNLVPVKPLQSMLSLPSGSSSSPLPGGSIFVTCSLILISRIAKNTQNTTHQHYRGRTCSSRSIIPSSVSMGSLSSMSDNLPLKLKA
jgi:hypothetical protein